ncbi:EscU/YscU/HrcU family type III secretion system export apparatus switch protein [Galbitalea soli]|uniref:EscU/YscU/HrcU family type III secretion system export apparatus switch protein n=1 Tax=Galbitalea soli TaxID=1268042 RepID=A0A7C9PN25_9MICO|nr:EscU/YscU/HrcU family type III secretion system export apparatus switch protein [Galbitalea soli]NEM91191.1 EscU/YscU/HrcU family type III secretion system export apparatus switch protein [Galbitalea soli]NYJ29880.1 flagellar biosynthetic protein FlhB [Galbitalea soli]
MSDSGERTEQATEKRMKEVRKKGEISTSKDLSGWLAVAAAIAMTPVVIDATTAACRTAFASVAVAVRTPEPKVALAALGQGFGAVIPALTPMFVVVVIAVVAGVALQGGIYLKAPTLSFKNFNPVAGLTRMFGTQALWEGVKNVSKTAIVGVVLFAVIQGLVPALMNAGGMSVTELLNTAQGAVGTLVQAAIAVGLIMAGVDVMVVIRRNRKRTRMTKREVRDEHKSSDGDPLVKSQRRSRALALTRNRMITAVESADVVMLNPTHIAVALKYEPGKSAPRVVAKGAGAVAARIREKAAENRIPMVEDIPLARALHAACEVGQEIPVDLYNAVARVLAFVMALKSKGAAQGIHRLATSPV